ncbi:Insulin-like growth factor-binding protein 2-B [Oryzias melastigma]|uniref:Insulin-like growth factor-binding protein 2-B n=1 Tax=Oryzias melastigma TaxID=30732 RepID=A0A834FRI9_ORYME|nr:Insulin-like growth factor-binding protein 2-B [Oryzias melastigma]
MVLLFTLHSSPGHFRFFRCSSCTAENMIGCPRVDADCTEVVREPGCGCCPVCARMEGEFCGVYTPRCSSGLICYPTMDAELPLEQLIQGFGRCVQKIDESTTITVEHPATNEVQGTESSLTKRPSMDTWMFAMKIHLKDLNSKMRTGQRQPQSPCLQELNKVLEEISKITSEDNRGPLEDLYGLKFPNCDRRGLYNVKQCNMSTHGQRGECWCVNPFTGVQIPSTPKIRGDPNCNQFQEELRAMPTETTAR